VEDRRLWKQRDPIAEIEQRVRADGVLKDTKAAEVSAWTDRVVEEAVTSAFERTKRP